MNVKIVVSAIIVIGFIILGSYSFLESNVEYTDVTGARKANRKVQLKGAWNRDRESSYDHEKSQFTFFLVDEAGNECKVILDGAAPNNFELASHVVAKGRFKEEGYFHATEVLTKCPSKYEGTVEEVKKGT